MTIAILVLVVSIPTLLLFLVQYCRSIVAASSRVELSEQARDVTGIQDHLIHANDFPRLLQMVELCPEPGGDSFYLRAVRAYYLLVKLLRGAVHPIAPRFAAWSERELQGCAWFAAVTLDRRIAYNRDLMTRQITNSL